MGPQVQWCPENITQGYLGINHMPVQGLWWSLCHCFFLVSMVYQLEIQPVFTSAHFRIRICSMALCYANYELERRCLRVFFWFFGPPRHQCVELRGSLRVRLWEDRAAKHWPSIGQWWPIIMERSTPRPAAVKTSMEEVGSQWRGVARSSVQSKFTLLDVFWRPFHNIIPFLRIPQKKITYNF